MDDLIASLSTSHMSQEHIDLETVKAHLARTLVVPASPTSSSSSTEGGSLPRTRPASLSLSLPSFTFDAAQPLPSPTAGYASLPYDELDAQPPAYSPSFGYAFEYEDEASLAAAFAGDAFAPMWQQQVEPSPTHADPWRAFREKQAAAAAAQQAHTLQLQSQFALPMEQQPAPEYQYNYGGYDDDEAMDEDAADAQLVLDEEELVNGGYSW
jgi:hypothetical protein